MDRCVGVSRLRGCECDRSETASYAESQGMSGQDLQFETEMTSTEDNREQAKAPTGFNQRMLRSYTFRTVSSKDHDP